MVSANLMGSGGLVKDSAGIVVLSGVNNYSGGTRVLAGVLQVRSVDSLPDGSSLTVGADSSLFGSGQSSAVEPSAGSLAASTLVASPTPARNAGHPLAGRGVPVAVPNADVGEVAKGSEMRRIGNLPHSGTLPPYGDRPYLPRQVENLSHNRAPAHDAVLQLLNTRAAVEDDKAAAFWDLDNGQSNRKHASRDNAVDAVLAMLEKM